MEDKPELPLKQYADHDTLAYVSPSSEESCHKRLMVEEPEQHDMASSNEGLKKSDGETQDMHEVSSEDRNNILNTKWIAQFHDGKPWVEAKSRTERKAHTQRNTFAISANRGENLSDSRQIGVNGAKGTMTSVNPRIAETCHLSFDSGKQSMRFEHPGVDT